MILIDRPCARLRPQTGEVLHGLPGSLGPRWPGSVPNHGLVHRLARQKMQNGLGEVLQAKTDIFRKCSVAWLIKKCGGPVLISSAGSTISRRWPTTAKKTKMRSRGYCPVPPGSREPPGTRDSPVSLPGAAREVRGPAPRAFREPPGTLPAASRQPPIAP